MRRVLGLLFAPLLLGNSSCQKKDPGPSALFGEWQWVSSKGGFTGREVNTPASTHHSRTLSFRRDSTFVQCDDGQCTRPSRFTSRTERSYLTGKPALMLTLHRHVTLTPADSAFSTVLDRNSLLEVSNTLRFQQDYPDSFEWTYQRK